MTSLKKWSHVISLYRHENRNILSFLAMTRIIISLLFGLFFCTNLSAEVYSTDATLVSQDGNIITVRSSAVADKKKDAALLAAKSAFHTLFHAGIEGVKDGTPMVAVERNDYDYRFFSESRYINYITSEVKTVGDKKVGNKVRVTVQLSINVKSLIADLQHNNMSISPSWGVASAKKSTSALNPTIVIVPGLKASKGSDFQAMLEAIDASEAKKYALDKMTGEFTKKGYKTRNFVSQLRNSKKDEMMRTESQSDINTMIVQQLPGDIIVTVDAAVVTDANNQMECQLSISAVESQTNGNLASATFPSGKYYKGNVSESELVDYAFKKINTDFFNQIKTSFEAMVSQGREVYVDMTISNSIDDWDFDQDSPSTGDNFKDVLDEWLRSHAQNSVYDMSNNTDKYIHMTVNIPLWNVERGRSYTLSNFSSDLKKFLKTQLGDGYKASVTAQGQKLEIMIQ